jgi:hypothetical protein
MGKNGTKTTLTVNSFKTNQPVKKINLLCKSKYQITINKLD